MKIVTVSLYPLRALVIILLLSILWGLIPFRDGFATEYFTPVDPPRAHYDIDGIVDFDSTRAVVSGTEIISFANTSPLPIEYLALSWVIDSLHTLNITADGQAAEIVSPDSDTDGPDPVIIRLPQALSPGHQLELRARFDKTYILEPGDDKHMWTDWFPRVYWGMQTQDDFIVKVENHSEYILTTSGMNDPGTGVYRAKNVRQFGLCFLKGVDVMERTVDDIVVRVTHTPAAVECADLVMKTAVDAIAYYKKRFGFYPSDHINIVQGVDAPNGGYPAATNLVVVHGMERMSEREESHWRWITAHEIGHQYWLEYVLPEFPDQIGWLMIGLGIYVDREYSKYCGLGTGQHLGLMGRFIEGAREGLDTRADVPSDYLDDIGFDFNNTVIHGKGYSIISALNCYLGDELFDRIHGRCLREFFGKRMGGYDFQRICEEESGQNLDWFFDQWVRSKRFVAYEIASQECAPQKGTYFSDIVVKKTGTLDMPVPVTAYFSDYTEQTQSTKRLQPISILRFESVAALDSAVVDAKNEIALVTPAPTSEEMKIRKRLALLPSRADIDSLPAIVAEALKLDINQTYFWGQLGRRLYGWGLYEEALAVFKRRTELLEQSKSVWVVSAYGWQGLLLDLLGRRTEAIDAYKKALETSTDRDFSYDGDPVTISRPWLEERLKTAYDNSEKP